MSRTVARTGPIPRFEHRSPVYRRVRAFGTPILVHAILLFFVVLCLFPVYLMFNASLKSQAELFRHTFALPKDPRWFNFPLIFIEREYYKNFINSIILAGSTTVLALILSILAGYAFALKKFFGKQTMFLCVLIGLMVSEISVLIPIYNILKDLNLLNTFAGLILPQTALGLSFGIFLITTFFKEIPRALVEAAVCDGCKDPQILWYVMIPVGMPADQGAGADRVPLGLEQLLLPARHRHPEGTHAAQRLHHRFHGALHVQLRTDRHDLRDHVRANPGAVPVLAGQLSGAGSRLGR